MDKRCILEKVSSTYRVTYNGYNNQLLNIYGDINIKIIKYL